MQREISKLVADGFYREALCLYAKQHSSSLGPNKFTFPYLLKSCGKLNAPTQGQILHTHLMKTGFGANIYASTALTDMYMKLHLLDYALKSFDEIPEPNLVLVNATLSGLSRNGHYREAFQMFRQVGLGKWRPDSVTLASLLVLCESLEAGLQVHCWAVKLGVETEVYVGTSLVTMYLGCAELVPARKMFEMISSRNVVSYNAYVSGLLQNGAARIVLDVFNNMKGCSPNSVTLIHVLSACSNLVYLQFGRQVHGLIKKTDMGFDTMVGTALVDMYSKCKQLKWAYDVFQELNGNRNLVIWNSMIAGMMSNDQSDNAIELFAQLESVGLKPDSATWNAMISGLMQLGKEFEAFMFFKKMQLAGIIPSLKSITSLLPVCSALSALRCGKEIHGHTIRTGIFKDEFICTAVVDMYMKCGLSSWGHRIFDLFEKKTNDPAIWNAMISGYGRNGDMESGFKVFDQMIEQRIKPNSATFNCILSMCSHTGQVEKGWQFLGMMSRDFGLKPTPGNINCIVDLLGRSGWLDEARELLQELPEPSASAIASLLNASKCHSDIKLGEQMAKMLSELEPENPTPLVILSNIYAGQGRWRDAEWVRKMMNDRGLMKLPGLSSIRVT
ncbi:hypothetical protein U1Q18_016921 [Sarracenia purpurea var. burkii]